MSALATETIVALSHLVQVGAALVIAVAVVRAFYAFLRAVWRREAYSLALEESRLALGHSLILSLEFLIAADILRTAVAPSWTDIGQLAAIVAIRTALSYFLSYELERAESRQGAGEGK